MEVGQSVTPDSQFLYTGTNYNILNVELLAYRASLDPK